MNAKIISNFPNATSAGVSTTKSYNPAQEKEMFYKTDKWGQVHIEKFFLWVVRDKFDFERRGRVPKAFAHGGVQFWKLIICIKKLHDI